MGCDVATLKWKSAGRPLESGERAAKIFAANERLNQMLIEHVAAEAWMAKPPGNVRSIAAIFAHVHNVRVKWIRLTAPHLKRPRLLGRGLSPQADVSAAFAQSAARCEEMLIAAFDGRNGKGRIEKFVRDGWGGPLPAGPEMLCYMVAHEAHHRGQVSMIAHQLGFKLPNEVTSRLWNWEKLVR